MAYINTLSVAGENYDISEGFVVNSVPRVAIAAVGSTIKFSVSASMFGSGATFQWQWFNSQGNWSNTTYSGNATHTVSTSAIASKNGLKFRCVITAGGVQYISTVSQIIVY